MPVTLRAAGSARGSEPGALIVGFTRIVRWALILSVPRLAAEFSRVEGITIKLVIRGTSTGFADAW
jgi:hypothetical protein